MAKKARAPRDRTVRRAEERAERDLVRDKEKLAARLPGGSEALPMEVPAASVIEVRATSTPCPQCAGDLHVESHKATSSGLRRVEVRCQRCGVARSMWFRIVGLGLN
jgi:hypothetical protein